MSRSLSSGSKSRYVKVSSPCYCRVGTGEWEREKMNGPDLRTGRRKSLKERLGFAGCCGRPIWGFRPTTVDARDNEEGDVEIHRRLPPDQPPSPPGRETRFSHPDDASYDPDCVDAGSGMNLAAALAAERQYREAHEAEGHASPPGTPLRVSLMRLLEETDGVEVAEEVNGSGGDGERDGGGGVVGRDSVCCVCMGRRKGAAFIPCGHTFCRVCSRELWLNRGSCPLCNRSILEILDIF